MNLSNKTEVRKKGITITLLGICLLALFGGGWLFGETTVYPAFAIVCIIFFIGIIQFISDSINRFLTEKFPNHFDDGKR